MKTDIKILFDYELSNVTLDELKLMQEQAIDYNISKTPMVIWVINRLSEEICKKQKYTC